MMIIIRRIIKNLCQYWSMSRLGGSVEFTLFWVATDNNNSKTQNLRFSIWCYGEKKRATLNRRRYRVVINDDALRSQTMQMKQIDVRSEDFESEIDGQSSHFQYERIRIPWSRVQIRSLTIFIEQWLMLKMGRSRPLSFLFLSQQLTVRYVHHKFLHTTGFELRTSL